MKPQMYINEAKNITIIRFPFEMENALRLADQKWAEYTGDKTIHVDGDNKAIVLTIRSDTDAK